MNLSKIKELGLLPRTIEGLDFDHVAAISTDEFNRPSNRGMDYRRDAIDRIVREGLPLWTNCNLTWDIVQRYVKMTCPYCKNEMTYDGGGGSASETSASFKCSGCKAYASLTLQNDRGIHFAPADQE